MRSNFPQQKYTKPFHHKGVPLRMDANPSLSPQMLDEDLQIVRATLATISDDVNRLSPNAGQAVHDAMEKIDEAHAEFVRASTSE